MASSDLASFFEPRWTWRPVFLAGTVTLGMYVLLPYLETLSAPPEKNMSVRTVTTVYRPPPLPAPPPPRVDTESAETAPDMPRPELHRLRRQVLPMQVAIDLRMAIGDVGGDFGVNFGISADTLDDQVQQLVFEVSDLDSPPRPLARLNPVYPSQARRRRIEGMVVVEFIVTADGASRDIVVVESLPDDVFTAAAVRAIEHWRFTPGTRDGEAVATRVRQKVEFKLE